MTEQVFTLHLATRNNLLTYLENVSPEKLAQIPAGFHNSILWNIAHCVATEQILFYKFTKKVLTPMGTCLQPKKYNRYAPCLSVPKNNCKLTMSVGYSATLPLIPPAMAIRSLVLKMLSTLIILTRECTLGW